MPEYVIERFLPKSKWIQYETPKGVTPWCLYTYVGNVVVATKCFKEVSGYDFMQYKTLMLRANAGTHEATGLDEILPGVVVLSWNELENRNFDTKAEAVAWHKKATRGALLLLPETLDIIDVNLRQWDEAKLAAHTSRAIELVRVWFMWTAPPWKGGDANG